jgi:hypothetical protein
MMASAERIWDLISDFEGVWENSNPAHCGTRVLSEPKRPIRDGLRWWQREKVGPVTGEFIATVHDVVPDQRFRWTAEATYRLLGLPVKIAEGGEFLIEPQTAGCRVSHRVWGQLPGGRFGRCLEWILVHLFRQREAVAHHTQVELEYFKHRLERKNDMPPE